MKFGVFLPTFLPPGSQSGSTGLRTFARAAEDLGFDSLWVTDHIVTAHRFYRVPWLDALSTLSYAAAITDRVNLGTSILIMPLRQPAVLAKEIATLQYLSDGRYICGAGVGWFGPEFEACGVHKSERGVRTDEVLDATLALLHEDEVTYHGRYYQLDEVTVEPHPSSPTPLWVGGGRQLPHEASPEQARMHPAVLRRIARADGWIARPTCPPALIRTDLDAIRSARHEAAGAGKSFTVAHENFVWIEETGRKEDVVAEQQRRFAQLMSDERPWDYIDAVYLTGTIDELHRRIQERIEAGVEYLILHTLTPDLAQLELLARHVLEPFRSAVPTTTTTGDEAALGGNSGDGQADSRSDGALDARGGPGGSDGHE